MIPGRTSQIRERRQSILDRVPFDGYVFPKDLGGKADTHHAHDLRALYHAGLVERDRTWITGNWMYRRNDGTE